MPKSTAPTQMLSFVNAAKKLDVSERTIQRLVAAGILPPPIVVGVRKVAFIEAELDEYLAARTKDRDRVVAAGISRTPPEFIGKLSVKEEGTKQAG